MSRKDVEAQGGRCLFMAYSSLKEMLMAIYPELPWEPSSFLGAEKMPLGHWKDNQNLLDILNKAEESLGITKVC